MRNSSVFSILSFLLFLSFTVQAQNLTWFESGANWTYNYQNVTGPDQYQVSFTTVDDNYGGQDCFRMDPIENFPFDCMPFDTPWYFYESNDSVFYATDLSPEFKLLYDFGAEVGDIWQYEVPHTGAGAVDFFNVQVVATGTEEIDGNSVSKIDLIYENLSTEPYLEMFPAEITAYEFMGANTGLFANFGNVMGCDAQSTIELQCFVSNGFNYTNPNFGNCTVSSDDQDDFALLAPPYPNPTSAQITFPIKASISLQNTQLFIYDSLGRTVFYSHLNQVHNDQIVFDTSNQMKGLYTYEVLQSRQYTRRGKFIIQ